MMPERSSHWIGVLAAFFALLAAVDASASMRSQRREMERVEFLLRESLRALPRDSGVVITREGTQVTLRFAAAMVFDPDSSAPKDDAMNSLPLQATLRVMRRRHVVSAQIAVYTDSIGGVSANQAFADVRANALCSLLGSAGLASPRLHPLGAGTRNALSSNQTPEGRSENRRIEIEFTAG